MKSSRRKMRTSLALTSTWSVIFSVANKESLSSASLNTHSVRSSTPGNIHCKSRRNYQVQASTCKQISSAKDLVPQRWGTSLKTQFQKLMTVSDLRNSNPLLQISITAKTTWTRISTLHTETLVKPFSVQIKRTSWIRTGVWTKEQLNQALDSTLPSLTLLVLSEWAL